MGRWMFLLALLPACGSSTNTDQPWTVIANDQPSSLQSVWASNETDVYVVGGDRLDGTGPIVDHYDGTTWTKLDSTARSINLWWTFGFAGGPVFMSGTSGTIVRYQDGAFQSLTTPGTATVYGMWGADATHLWAVGGNGAGGGFVWQFDGTTWTARTDVPADIVSSGTIWKIGGRSADDIWMSGTHGTMLHWDGRSLAPSTIPVAEGSLFSVAGSSARYITVGSDSSGAGVIYENDGGGWKSVLPAGGNLLTGVAVSDDQAYAVGQHGTILTRGDSGWSQDSSATNLTTQPLHGAFIDSTGGAWAVGGCFDNCTPQSGGVLLHKGNALKGTVP